MVFEVSAKHLGRERVDGYARGHDGVHDLFAAALLGKKAFHGVDLPANAPDSGNELGLLTDRVHGQFLR
jgi:hypothetical protein